MRNKLTRELAVCGLKAALALGEYHRDRINRLFLREDRLGLFSKVCKDLAERRRPYKLCADEELERICKSNRHQGVVAMIEEPPVPPLSEEDVAAWAGESLTGLILHSVGNDHNLGAMARSAAFFGARFIVVNAGDEEAKLTTSAYRVAEGGMEHVEFRRVDDTARCLKGLSRSILTIGAELRARQRIRDLPAVVQSWERKGASKNRKARRPGIALVVGNEETGLPQEVQEACSALVRIPGSGVMESLNAAHAATLFLHELYEL
jgi:TrmH RNA methyltransferase